MVRRRLFLLLLSLVVLPGCGGAVAAGAGDGPAVVVPGAPGEAAQVLPAEEAVERMTPQPVSPADVAFVSGMVPHHRQALEMAALAPERAADPQVVAMAERITAVQGPEIAALEGWLASRADDAGQAHGGGHADHGGLHPGMATPEQIAALAAASGPEFDALFLQMMIAHHEGALQMANDRRDGGGTDVQAELMADDVAVTQSAEIARMRAMQAA